MYTINFAIYCVNEFMRRGYSRNHAIDIVSTRLGFDPHVLISATL